uniref:Uncharacterized protein n=1 Tax=Knipowitschia caucasica TaxID=637954 RepID=A0AAV2KAK5_KNICA
MQSQACPRGGVTEGGVTGGSNLSQDGGPLRDVPGQCQPRSSAEVRPDACSRERLIWVNSVGTDSAEVPCPGPGLGHWCMGGSAAPQTPFCKRPVFPPDPSCHYPAPAGPGCSGARCTAKLRQAWN